MQGQDGKSIFKTFINKNKAISSYQVDLTYNLFENENSTKVIDQYVGSLFKNNLNIYNKVGIAEIVQTSEFSLLVNHEEKAILLNEPEGYLSENINFNFESVLSFVDIKLAETNTDYWAIDLIAKEVSQLPYYKMTFYIDNKTYLLKKQVLYYFAQYDLNEKEEYDNPRVEITYSKYRYDKFTISKDVFKLEKYMILKENTYFPSSYCKNYEIVNNLN